MKEAITEEEAQNWINVTLGFSNKYIFRGTDLTPDSDGIIFAEGNITGPGFTSAGSFTIGVWAARQLKDATAAGTGLGESGGGGRGGLGDIDFDLGAGFIATDFSDTAIQSTFSEYDFYLQYAHSFGWVDVTVGNIAFIVEREQIDLFQFVVRDTLGEFADERISIPFASIGDEVFDRLFVSVSSSKLPYVTPSLTYYQTIYNEGDEGAGPDILLFERNDSLGGYLEGKVAASFPIWGGVFSINPSALISYSFDDRSEATNNPFMTAEPYSGFYHTQVGTEVAWNATKNIRLVVFGNYSHKFAEPTAGNEEDTFWCGTKISASF